MRSIAATLWLVTISGAAHAGGLPIEPGSYAGFNFGMAAGDAGLDPTGVDLASQFRGYLVGGQAGYRLVTRAGLIVGIEASLDMSKESGGGSETVPFNPFLNTPPRDDLGTQTNARRWTSDWTGSLVASVGYQIGAVAPYAMAGIEGHGDYLIDSLTYSIHRTTFPANADQRYSASATSVGVVAGAGIAAQFEPHLSGFVEARYSGQTSAFDVFGFGGPRPFDIRRASVRSGLNFNF